MVYVLQEASRRRNAMQMEILYFDGCPTYLKAEKTLREVLEEEGLEAEVDLIAVNTDEEAQELRFAGSPTIRVNGEDLAGSPGGGGPRRRGRSDSCQHRRGGPGAPVRWQPDDQGERRRPVPRAGAGEVRARLQDVRYLERPERVAHDRDASGSAGEDGWRRCRRKSP